MVGAAAAVTVSVLATPVVPRYVCPSDCGRPPIGKPVATNPWFTSSDGKFAVQYPRAGTAYDVTLDPYGVEVNFTAGDTGTMEFFGMPAGDRTPKQLAEDLIGEHYPDATTDYEIHNAMVGYQPAPRIQPRLWQRTPAWGQPATGTGHGQIREQLHLARRFAPLEACGGVT